MTKKVDALIMPNSTLSEIGGSETTDKTDGENYDSSSEHAVHVDYGNGGAGPGSPK